MVWRARVEKAPEPLAYVDHIYRGTNVAQAWAHDAELVRPLSFLRHAVVDARHISSTATSHPGLGDLDPDQDWPPRVPVPVELQLQSRPQNSGQIPYYEIQFQSHSPETTTLAYYLDSRDGAQENTTPAYIDIPRQATDGSLLVTRELSGSSVIVTPSPDDPQKLRVYHDTRYDSSVLYAFDDVLAAVDYSDYFHRGLEIGGSAAVFMRYMNNHWQLIAQLHDPDPQIPGRLKLPHLWPAGHAPEVVKSWRVDVGDTQRESENAHIVLGSAPRREAAFLQRGWAIMKEIERLITQLQNDDPDINIQLQPLNADPGLDDIDTWRTRGDELDLEKNIPLCEQELSRAYTAYWNRRRIQAPEPIPLEFEVQFRQRTLERYIARLAHDIRAFSSTFKWLRNKSKLVGAGIDHADVSQDAPHDRAGARGALEPQSNVNGFQMQLTLHGQVEQVNVATRAGAASLAWRAVGDLDLGLGTPAVPMRYIDIAPSHDHHQLLFKDASPESALVDLDRVPYIPLDRFSQGGALSIANDMIEAFIRADAWAAAIQEVLSTSLLQGRWMPILRSFHEPEDGSDTLQFVNIDNPLQSRSVKMSSSTKPAVREFNAYINNHLQNIHGEVKDTGPQGGFVHVPRNANSATGIPLSMPPVGGLGSITIVQTLIKYLGGKHQPNAVTEGATPELHLALQFHSFVTLTKAVYATVHDAAQLKGLVDEVLEGGAEGAARVGSGALSLTDVGSAVLTYGGFALSIVSIGADIWELSNATTETQRIVIRTQLVLDSGHALATVGVWVVEAIYGSTAGVLGFGVGVLLAGLGVGIAALAANQAEVEEKAKRVGKYFQNLPTAYETGGYKPEAHTYTDPESKGGRKALVPRAPGAIIKELDLRDHPYTVKFGKPWLYRDATVGHGWYNNGFPKSSFGTCYGDEEQLDVRSILKIEDTGTLPGWAAETTTTTLVLPAVPEHKIDYSYRQLGMFYKVEYKILQQIAVIPSLFPDLRWMKDEDGFDVLEKFVQTGAFKHQFHRFPDTDVMGPYIITSVTPQEFVNTPVKVFLPPRPMTVVVPLSDVLSDVDVLEYTLIASGHSVQYRIMLGPSTVTRNITLQTTDQHTTWIVDASEYKFPGWVEHERPTFKNGANHSIMLDNIEFKISDTCTKVWSRSVVLFVMSDGGLWNVNMENNCNQVSLIHLQADKYPGGSNAVKKYLQSLNKSNLLPAHNYVVIDNYNPGPDLPVRRAFYDVGGKRIIDIYPCDLTKDEAKDSQVALASDACAYLFNTVHIYRAGTMLAYPGSENVRIPGIEPLNRTRYILSSNEDRIDQYRHEEKRRKKFWSNMEIYAGALWRVDVKTGQTLTNYHPGVKIGFMKLGRVWVKGTCNLGCSKELAHADGYSKADRSGLSDECLHVMYDHYHKIPSVAGDVQEVPYLSLSYMINANAMELIEIAGDDQLMHHLNTIHKLDLEVGKWNIHSLLKALNYDSETVSWEFPQDRGEWVTATINSRMISIPIVIPHDQVADHESKELGSDPQPYRYWIRCHDRAIIKQNFSISSSVTVHFVGSIKPLEGSKDEEEFYFLSKPAPTNEPSSTCTEGPASTDKPASTGKKSKIYVQRGSGLAAKDPTAIPLTIPPKFGNLMPEINTGSDGAIFIATDVGYTLRITRGAELVVAEVNQDWVTTQSTQWLDKLFAIAREQRAASDSFWGSWGITGPKVSIWCHYGRIIVSSYVKPLQLQLIGLTVDGSEALLCYWSAPQKGQLYWQPLLSTEKLAHLCKDPYSLSDIAIARPTLNGHSIESAVANDIGFQCTTTEGITLILGHGHKGSIALAGVNEEWQKRHSGAEEESLRKLIKTEGWSHGEVVSFHNTDLRANPAWYHIASRAVVRFHKVQIQDRPVWVGTEDTNNGLLVYIYCSVTRKLYQLQMASPGHNSDTEPTVTGLYGMVKVVGNTLVLYQPLAPLQSFPSLQGIYNLIVTMPIASPDSHDHDIHLIISQQNWDHYQSIVVEDRNHEEAKHGIIFDPQCMSNESRQDPGYGQIFVQGVAGDLVLVDLRRGQSLTIRKALGSNQVFTRFYLAMARGIYTDTKITVEDFMEAEQWVYNRIKNGVIRGITLETLLHFIEARKCKGLSDTGTVNIDTLQQAEY